MIMVNNDPNFPPLEGPITSNPDDGVPFTVTIPFIGVRGPATTATSDGARLRALPDGTPTSMTPTSLTNPGFRAFASFSSGGPRTGDSGLKPDITGPGVSIVSTGSGTGNKAATISGTSMASPHVAGVAALTRQAHPTWTVEDIKASIVNTGDPAQVVGYRTSRGGTGLVQPQKSTTTQVVAKASGDEFAISVNFGFEELLANYSKTREITLKNNGATPATFGVAQANATTSTAALGRAERVVGDRPRRWDGHGQRDAQRRRGRRGRLEPGPRVPRGRRPDHVHAGGGEQQRRHAPRAVLPRATLPLEGRRGARQHGDQGEERVDDRHHGDRDEPRRRPLR